MPEAHIPLSTLRNWLDAITSDLRRRRFEGEDQLYLREDTLIDFQQKLRQLPILPPDASPRTENSASAPKSPGELVFPAPSPPPEADLHPAQSEPETSAPKRDASPAPDTSTATSAVPASFPAPVSFQLPEGDKRTRMDWLIAHIQQDPVCRSQARLELGKKIVVGTGNLDAAIFFCGEAPGADEETQGEPFVGRAGQLLEKIIRAMGLTRQDVYIGNILNWRPVKEDMSKGNRPPTPEEICYCLPFLEAQIAIVQPKVIVALGNTAVSGLLGSDPKRRLGQIRGTWLSFQNYPLLPTFHPSYVLQYGTPKIKRQIWEDMLTVMEQLGMPISDKQRGYFS